MNLIDDARQAWKMWSVKLAAVTGIITTIMASNQTIALGLIHFLPDGPLRIVVAALIGLVVFVIPTALRLIQQPKLSKCDEPASE